MYIITNKDGQVFRANRFTNDRINASQFENLDDARAVQRTLPGSWIELADPFNDDQPNRFIEWGILIAASGWLAFAVILFVKGLV